MYADMTEPEMFSEWLSDLNEAEIAEWIEGAHAEGVSLFQFWQSMEFADWDAPAAVVGGDEHTAYDEIGSTRTHDAGEATRASDWSAPFWKGAKT